MALRMLFNLNVYQSIWKKKINLIINKKREEGRKKERGERKRRKKNGHVLNYV